MPQNLFDQSNENQLSSYLKFRKDKQLATTLISTMFFLT
jgi:hypothetical protein